MSDIDEGDREGDKAHDGIHCSCGHRWSMHNEFGCFTREGGIAGHDQYCFCHQKPPEMVADEMEKRRQRELLYPCKKHYRYQILRRPTSACEKCWRMWIAVHP